MAESQLPRRWAEEAQLMTDLSKVLYDAMQSGADYYRITNAVTGALLHLVYPPKGKTDGTEFSPAERGEVAERLANAAANLLAFDHEFEYVRLRMRAVVEETLSGVEEAMGLSS